MKNKSFSKIAIALIPFLLFESVEPAVAQVAAAIADMPPPQIVAGSNPIQAPAVSASNSGTAVRSAEKDKLEKVNVGPDEDTKPGVTYKYFEKEGRWIDGPAAAFVDLSKAGYEYKETDGVGALVKDGQKLTNQEAQDVLRRLQKERHDQYVVQLRDETLRQFANGHPLINTPPVFADMKQGAESADAAPAPEAKVWDPLRPFNEKALAFDLYIDNKGLQPVSQVYAHGFDIGSVHVPGVPQNVRDALTEIFKLLDMDNGALGNALWGLVQTVWDAVRLKGSDAWDKLVGVWHKVVELIEKPVKILGLLTMLDDYLKKYLIEPQEVDRRTCDQTLAKVGVPEGPPISPPLISDWMTGRELGCWALMQVASPTSLFFSFFQRVFLQAWQRTNDRDREDYEQRDPARFYEYLRDRHLRDIRDKAAS